MELIIEIDMEKQTRLKNKINFNFPKPKKKNAIKKKIALFDLDETLVHCTGDIKLKKEKYQHAIEIKLPGKQAVQVGINLRPYWKQTLRLIKKNYHIVVYTASHQAYADSVLDFMDPKKKYFKYRLYRNNCSLIDVEGAKFYVKDLDILNEYYDLKDIVIIDNSVLSFAFHLHNGIPIVPYYDEDKDGSLYVVGLYLIHIFPENDLREANKTQINLDSFLEEAKRQKEEEEKNIINEESGDEEQEEQEEKSEDDDSKNNLFDIKKGEATNRTFKDNRNFAFTVKKKTLFDNIQHIRRRKSQDLTQNKLISKSRLINMYYEVNSESHKNLDNKIIERNEENEDNDNDNDKSEISLIRLNDVEKGNEIIEEEKPTIVALEEGEGEGEGEREGEGEGEREGEGEGEEEKEKEKESFKERNGELNCKNEHVCPLEVENENNNDSDNDSISEENNQTLRRGFTITANNHKEKKEKNDINGKLNYIRSNFFNNFKI
jgi:Dullard-like phosphatase family protein